MNKNKIGIELIFLISILSILSIPLSLADECSGGNCGADISLNVTTTFFQYQENASNFYITTHAYGYRYYANYTKPFGVLSNSMWRIKAGNRGDLNVTIPANCFAQNPIQFQFLGQTSVGNSDNRFYCWSGASWFQMVDSEYGSFSSLGSGSITALTDGDWNTYALWNSPLWNTINVGDKSGALWEEAMWWAINPMVSITFPTNITYNYNVTTLNYLSSDNNPDKCWYSKNGGATNSTSVNAGTNFTGITSIEGSNTWNLYCNDTFGNMISTSIIFKIDTISPSAQSGGSGGTSPNNASSTSIPLTNFTVNASDTGSGISNITFTITNETGGILNETTAEGNNVVDLFLGFVYNLWYEGIYKWFFKVVDAVGNVFTTEESSLTYSNLHPNGAIIYPLNTTYSYQITSMNISLNGTGTNISDCWYNAGGSNVSITDVSNKTISSYKIEKTAHSPAWTEPNNSITFMNDSNLSTKTNWLGDGVGIGTKLNMSYLIDVNKISNVRFIFDYQVQGTLYAGAINYWNWSSSSWTYLSYIGDGTPTGHYVLNVSLPSEAIDNFGNVSIQSPELIVTGYNNFSIYETYITYTQTGGNCSNTSIIGLASSEGSNTWKFWVNDSFGFENESAVTFTQDTGKPLVTIHSPISPYYYNTTSVLVNLSATDSLTPISQIWWSVDGGSNHTYSSPSIETFTEATHNIIAWANDSAGNINSTNKSFIIDLTPPIIVLNPISNLSTDIFPKNVSITYLIGDMNINTCWYNNGEDLNESLTSDDTSNIGSSWSIEFMGTSNQRFAMKKFVCGNISKLGFNTRKDNSTGEPITNWSIKIRSVATDKILLEKDMGAISNLSYPSRAYYEADFNTSKFICENVWLSQEAYNLTIGHLAKVWNNDIQYKWATHNGTNYVINYSSPYSLYHGFYYDGSAWISDTSYSGVPAYNLTINNKILENGTLNCSGTSASIPITSGGNKTITIYGTDNMGLTSSDNESFYALFHSYTQSTEINTTTEGSVLDFTLNVNMTNLHDTSAYLVYAGVSYLADSFNEIGNSVSFLKTLTIPNGVGSIAGANATWYWKYSIAGFETNYTTSPQIQKVYSVEIDDCSIYNDTILHFDLNDEALDTRINASLNPFVEADVQIVSLGDANVYWQFNRTWDATNGSICIPNGLLNISSYKFNGILSYLTDNYVQEFWYINNGLLQDNVFALDNYTNRNVTLRDLILIDSQTFLFKYYNEEFLTQPNSIVIVLRKYIGEGTFKEVERCLLDDNGECHLHLVEEDVIYKFRIITNGVEDFLSGDYNAKCVETPCSITLQKEVVSEGWDTTINNLAEGSYHIETDKDNRTVTLSFNLNETGTMQLDVFVYSNVINSPDVLVGTDVVTAKEGFVSVDIPLSYGNKTYYAVVRHNTGFVSSSWIDLSESGYHYFGALGLFLGALLVLSLGLIAVSSGGWTIAFLILGLIIASATKLFDMDVYLIMFIISAGGLVIWRLASRRSL